MKSEDITQKITLFITLDDQPFSAVKDTTFQQLIAQL